MNKKQPELEKLPITGNPWKRQSSELAFDNPWISLFQEDVINPGGGLSHYGRIHFKNLALGIIPLDEDNNTWLVGQYRYAPDCYSWELPMGGGPLGIDPLESARRELKEETGLIASDWEQIMHIHTTNSVSDEYGYVYVARGLTHGEMEPEESEDLVIRKMPLEEAVARAMNGEITDAISLAGLLKLHTMLNQ